MTAVLAAAFALVAERLGLPAEPRFAIAAAGSPRSLSLADAEDSELFGALAVRIAEQVAGSPLVEEWSVLLIPSDPERQTVDLLLETELDLGQQTLDAAAAALAQMLASLGPDTTIGQARDALDEIARASSRLSATPLAVDGDRSVLECFHAVADEYPHAPAVTDAHERLDYAELAARANGLGAAMRGAGTRPGDAVAVLLEKSPTAVATAIGAWETGAAYVHLDPSEPPSRIQRLIETARATCVVTQDDHRHLLDGCSLPIVLAAEVEVVAGTSDPLPGANGRDLAYLVFTSGSEGTPKAVEVEHRSLLAYVEAFLDRLGPIEPASYASVTTLASDLGNTSIYASLLTGARLDLYSRSEVLDRAAFSARLASSPVDCLKCTPSQLAALADDAIGELLPARALILGGEQLSSALVRRVLEARPDLAVYNHYGPSETTVGAIVNGPLKRAEVDSEGPVAIGVPLGGLVLDVLNDAGRPVIGATGGTLRIGGPTVARGYRGGTHGTGGFRDGAYDTGDVVSRRRDDGAFVFVGRADEQFKLRGHRVEPAEVAAELTALAGVREAVARGKDGKLTAFVVLDANTTDRMLVREEFSKRMPAQMVPSRLQVVPEIPLGLNGKVNFRVLEELSLNEETLSPDARPREGLEEWIARLWCDALDRDEVGREEKFFEIGGDSLMALGIFASLRAEYPDIAIADLFGHPTIASLATAIEGEPAPAPTANFVDLS